MKAKFMTIFAILMLTLGLAHAEDSGEWFFRNNVPNYARLIELHMLGAHDAFTAGLNENSDPDTANIKLENNPIGSSALAADNNTWKSLALNMSKAQSADVETMLNKGVRYFDVRLSRYKNGGEFYTTHGRISDQLTGPGGIARKIAAWAKNHPGEIIILDFQSLADIHNGSNASATQQSWKDLINKLAEDGVTQYVYTRNGSVNTYTYGSLTNNGTRPAIVLIGQVTGSWADNRFINRRNDDGDSTKDDGYVRSYWTNTYGGYEKIMESLSQEIDYLQNNSDRFYYRLRVMQAQTTPSAFDIFNNPPPNLLADADKNNPKIINDPRYDAWSEILPILLVDNATTDSEDFNAKAVDLLAKKNREYTPGVYKATDGNYTLTGSNDNVPLGTKFTASREGDVLTLDGEITGEMTLVVKSNGKKQRLYKDGELLGETGGDGLLRANITALGRYTLTDTDESIDFAVTAPLLRYTFVDGLTDVTGNGLDAAPEGNPTVTGGAAGLTPDNVIKLPVGLTKHMKEYTVTAWVKMNADVKNSRLFDICRGQRSSIFAHAASNMTSSGLKTSSGDTKSAKGPGLKLNEWTHIAAKYKNGTLTLYINGVQAAADTTYDPAPNLIEDYLNAKGSFIGRTSWKTFNENANDNPDINGSVADFRIYDITLSANEIARLARKPQAKFIDIDTGSEIQTALELSVDKAYIDYEFPQSIDGYELVRTEANTDMAGSGAAIGYYRSDAKPAGSLTVTTDGGNAKAVLTLAAERPDTWLILAVYRGGGLEAVKIADVTGSGAELTAPAPEGTTVKAFLWEKNTLRPIMTAE